MEGIEVVDGYDPMMYACCVKTTAEIELLKRATSVNELAVYHKDLGAGDDVAGI